MTLVVKRDVTWNRGSSEKERLSNIAQGQLSANQSGRKRKASQQGGTA